MPEMMICPKYTNCPYPDLPCSHQGEHFRRWECSYKVTMGPTCPACIPYTPDDPTKDYKTSWGAK